MKHFYILRKHYSDSRTVILKNISDVSVVVGKHKVQSIPNVFKRRVMPDNRMGYKLEVNTIAVTRNGVRNNSHAITLPAMNTITTLLFLFAIGSQCVFFDRAINAVLGIYAEERIVQDVVPYYYVPAI